MNEHVPIICPIDNRVELFPFWLNHYANQGFKVFKFALWNGRSNPCLSEIEAMWEQHKPDGDSAMTIGVSRECSYDEYNGPSETPGLNAIRETLRSDWYAIADLDEFAEDPHIEGRESYEAIGGAFVDRIAADGSFPKIPLWAERNLDDMFPMAANLTASNPHRCNCNKVFYARTYVPICSGHHFVAEQYRWLRDAIPMHHFKWHSGVIDLLPRRYAAYKSQGLNWADESLWFIDLFKDPMWHKRPELNTRHAARLGV